MATAVDKYTDGLPVNLRGPSPRQLFVHDTAVTRDPGFMGVLADAQQYFPERALWLAGPQDLVLLAQPLEPAYASYLATLNCAPRYQSVASTTDTPLTLQLLQDADWHLPLRDWLKQTSPVANAGTSALQLNTYCTTAESIELADHIAHLTAYPITTSGDPETTYQANQKIYQRQEMGQLGFEPIPGKIVQVDEPTSALALNSLWQAVCDIIPQTGSVMIRSNYASGGGGNIRLSGCDQHKLSSWLKNTPGDGKYLVEAYLPSTTSPNLQYWVDHQGVSHHILTTDQRMSDDLLSVGSRYPGANQDNQDLHAAGNQVVQWLRDQGLRGMIGLDFLCDQHTGAQHFVEANVRFNGSSYASAIWFRINAERRRLRQDSLGFWQSRRYSHCPAISFA
ncbi:MAG: hypothetical protein AAF993_11165, partial [Pseudomonadota bacterium]